MNSTTPLIIGCGNAGSNVVKLIAKSASLTDTKLYAIDSVASVVELDYINRINIIPIISDDKDGSGRNRERGKAMFQYHDELGDFKQMYLDAANAKSPIIVITSAAGGTGSGSVVPLCQNLVNNMGLHVIPIIVCPSLEDPIAYQLNANDLVIELADVGIETYSIFRNQKGNANYDPINNDIVNLIEIIFGKKYDKTDLDSIDDSDLDTILNTPGRFMAISASSDNVSLLAKEITRKAFTGYQPGWTLDEAKKCTLMTAYSLSSLFAKEDFASVFSDVNERITNVYDEYRNICQTSDGTASATMIVAGLPRVEFKVIDAEFNTASSIGDGLNRSKRPSFMSKKKAVISPTKKTSTETSSSDDGSAISKFSWK